ncbi:MAG: hypothetical protein KU38_08680 [Sulfurovum sp. FS08-3]|nr:MAG: hypothetical protein KU38_08680 [Sulfurovum sp. FS08-3]
MTINEATELLDNVELPIHEVKTIFHTFKDNAEVVGMVAMNVSRRTSVYDHEIGKSDTLVELLIELSRVKDMGSRWAVAKNHHTPAHILTQLALDEINLVRALVATNPNTPVSVLETLFNDEKIVRDGLSGNIHTPSHLLLILADDSDKMVRMRIAENPSATQEILERLLSDEDEDVKKAAHVNWEAKNGQKNE